MTRGVFGLAAALAVIAVLAGCQTQQQTFPPTMVKEYSVELEFVLIRVEPAEPAAEGVETNTGMFPFLEPVLLDERRDESRSGFVSYGPMILQPKPPVEPIPGLGPGTGEPPLEEPLPPPLMPGEEEMLPPGEEEPLPSVEPEGEEPVVPVPGEIEIVIYSVRQSLAVGDKIEVDRSENVSYREEHEGVSIEIEGTRRFTVEGTSKQIGKSGDFRLSIELTFIDESLKMNYTCRPSKILSATSDSEHILAASGNLRVRLICRKDRTVEYER